jgi:Txe/YoeB family toxin of Txe-Axe toxin-antitoxin module
MGINLSAKELNSVKNGQEITKIAKKIITLIKDISGSPYSGLGKLEPLKYELSGY